MDLRWLLRDRRFALISICADVLSNLAAVSGIWLLAERFAGIGAMTADEILFMLSFTTLVTDVFQMFFAANNVGHISRRIGRGQVEHMQLQPLPLAAQLLTEGFAPFSGGSNLLAGIVMMTIAVRRLQIPFTLFHILSVAGHLLLTTLLIVSLSYLASSLAFYAPVQSEEISTFVIDSFGTLSKYPLSGMPKSVQLPLLTVIPSGLMGWFQALAILGKPPFGIPIWYPALCAVSLGITAAHFFRKGLKYYVKKGINRYTDVGHRR